MKTSIKALMAAHASPEGRRPAVDAGVRPGRAPAGAGGVAFHRSPERGAIARVRERLRSIDPLQAAILVGVVIFAVELCWLPVTAYLNPLNIDDSFYYFTIARNFSHGRFSTFDGTIVTNGYHPLWAFALTPVFGAVADRLQALKAEKMLEIGLLLASSMLAVAAMRRAGWPAAATATFPVMLFAMPVVYQGMETAIQVLLLAALMRAWVSASYERGLDEAIPRLATICAAAVGED